jgi:hypothetical protein
MNEFIPIVTASLTSSSLTHFVSDARPHTVTIWRIRLLQS